MARGMVMVDAKYTKEIERARRSHSALISDKNCALIILHLAWHDAGTYDAKTQTEGPNRSIRNDAELRHSSNNGIKIAVDLCEEIKAKHQKITYANLYQLAEVLAVEVTGSPTIDFVPGERTPWIAQKKVAFLIPIKLSFFWGYVLSQLPGGWLAKIFGGRLVFEELEQTFKI